VRFPNVYGIDMPTPQELVAHDRTVEQIRELIGCDALIYQDVDAMKRAVYALRPGLENVEASCFDGVYITGDVSAADFDAMKAQRASQPQAEEGAAADRSRLALPNSGG